MRRPYKRFSWRARPTAEPVKACAERKVRYSALAPESLTALAQRGISVRR